MAEIKNYVNNKELLNHLIQRKSTNDARLLEGLPKIPVDNYLGRVILEIATRLAYRPNFINYSYKSEMIGDAVENGLKGIENFDCENYTNPFGYLTQIMWHAFIRRIQIEQKQQDIKGAMISEMPLDELFSTQDHDEDGIQYSHHILGYLRDNNFSHTRLEKESDTDQPTNAPLPAPVLKGLDKFFE